MNKCKKAVMENVTFRTAIGELALQDLFNLPITGELSLNTIGRSLKKELAEKSEAIVKVASTKDQKLQFKLDLVTDVVDAKLKLEDQARLSAAQRSRRQALTQALEIKLVDNLSKMSEEDILKELDAMK